MHFSQFNAKKNHIHTKGFFWQEQHIEKSFQRRLLFLKKTHLCEGHISTFSNSTLLQELEKNSGRFLTTVSDSQATITHSPTAAITLHESYHPMHIHSVTITTKP